MGFRFLILVVSFIGVSINSIYANTTIKETETINSVLSTVNSKVRKTKSCQEINQYISILDNLEIETLSRSQEKRLVAIRSNQC